MGFFKKNDGYQLSSVLCLRVLGLNKGNMKMVFRTGSIPVLATRVMSNVSPNCTMLTDGKTSLIQLTAESHTVRRPDVSKLEVH